MSNYSRYTTPRGQQLLKGKKLTDSIYHNNPTHTTSNQHKKGIQHYNRATLYNQSNFNNNPQYPRLTYQQNQNQNNQFRNYQRQQLVQGQQKSDEKQQKQGSCCSCCCCCLTFCVLILLLIILVSIAVGLLYYLGYLKVNINFQNPAQSNFKLNFSKQQHMYHSNIETNFILSHGNSLQPQISASPNHIKTTLKNQPANTETNQIIQSKTSVNDRIININESEKKTIKKTTKINPSKNLHRIQYS